MDNGKTDARDPMRKLRARLAVKGFVGGLLARKAGPFVYPATGAPNPFAAPPRSAEFDDWSRRAGVQLQLEPQTMPSWSSRPAAAAAAEKPEDFAAEMLGMWSQKGLQPAIGSWLKSMNLDPAAMFEQGEDGSYKFRKGQDAVLRNVGGSIQPQPGGTRAGTALAIGNRTVQQERIREAGEKSRNAYRTAMEGPGFFYEDGGQVRWFDPKRSDGAKFGRDALLRRYNQFGDTARQHDLFRRFSEGPSSAAWGNRYNADLAAFGKQFDAWTARQQRPMEIFPAGGGAAAPGGAAPPAAVAAAPLPAPAAQAPATAPAPEAAPATGTSGGLPGGYGDKGMQQAVGGPQQQAAPATGQPPAAASPAPAAPAPAAAPPQYTMPKPYTRQPAPPKAAEPPLSTPQSRGREAVQAGYDQRQYANEQARGGFRDMREAARTPKAPAPRTGRAALYAQDPLGPVAPTPPPRPRTAAPLGAPTEKEAARMAQGLESDRFGGARFDSALNDAARAGADRLRRRRV